MPQKLIKILSWNVENFGRKPSKNTTVINKIKTYDPDIIAIYEVEKPSVYSVMQANFPNYSMFLTEGQQNKEILVACKNIFEGIKFEKKEEFKSGNPYLRPGVFLTFRYPGKSEYGFLFLHTDSGTEAVDFGNRNEMFEHAFNLKRTLDKIVNNPPANFMILGDLNTMGLKYPKQLKAHQKAVETDEITFIDLECTKTEYNKADPKMRRLNKPPGTFYYSKTIYSDLDHIIASDHLTFNDQEHSFIDGKFEVKLDGWRNEPDDQTKKQYTKDISDHCLLYCELIVP